MLDVQAVIPKLRAWAERTPLIRGVVIYGSYAKGTAREESDLDVAVIIAAVDGDTDAGTTWVCEGQKWSDEVRRLLEFPRVHLEWLDEENPPVLAGVEEARIVVYRAKAER